MVRGKGCLFSNTSDSVVAFSMVSVLCRSISTNFEGRSRLYKAQPTHSAILSSLPFLSAGFRWRRLAKVRYPRMPSGTVVKKKASTHMNAQLLLFVSGENNFVLYMHNVQISINLRLKIIYRAVRRMTFVSRSI